MRLLVRSFVAASLAASVAACLVLLAGPERLPLAAHVEYLPYPLFLAPAVLALALAVRMGPAWIAAAALNIALVVGVVMDLRLATPAHGTGSVRLMTFNVKDYETLELPGGEQRIAQEVARFDPDIIVMQDASGIGERVQAHTLFAGRHFYAAGEYVVVSRFPLADCAAFRVPVPGKALHHVRCEVRSPDWRLEVNVVHLLSPRRGLDALRYGSWDGLVEWKSNVETRMAQARALARALAGAKHPAVLAGDLNAPPRSLVLDELAAAGFHDAFAAAGRGFGFTYGQALRTHFSFLRIDHVLVDGTIGVADCFVAPAGISPHRAVIADLVLHPSG